MIRRLVLAVLLGLGLASPADVPPILPFPPLIPWVDLPPIVPAPPAPGVPYAP